MGRMSSNEVGSLGYAAGIGVSESCEEVAQQLIELSGAPMNTCTATGRLRPTWEAWRMESRASSSRTFPSSV